MFLILMITLLSTFSLKSDTIDNQIQEFLNSTNSQKEEKFNALIQSILYLKIDERLNSFKRLENEYPDKSSPQYVEILKNISNIYIFYNKNDLFELYFYKALTLATKNDYPVEAGKLFLLKADYFKNKFVLDSCLYYCLKSEELFNKNNNTIENASVYHIMGDIYYHLELYENSEVYYKKTIEFGQNSSNWLQWRKIVVYTNLGNIFTNQKRYNEAYDCFKIAENQINQNQIKHLTDIPKEQLAHVYKCLCYYFLDLNKIDSASHYINIAVNYLEESGTIEFQPDIYNALGEVFMARLNYTDAEKYFLKALNLLDTNSAEYVSKCYEDLSELYNETKNYKEAYKYLKLNAVLRADLNKKNNSSRTLQFKVVRDFNLLNQQIEEKNSYLLAFTIFSIILLILIIIIFIYYKKLNHSYKLVVEKTFQLVNIKDDEPILIDDILEANLTSEKTEEPLEVISDIIIEADQISIVNNINSEELDESAQMEVKVTPELIALAKEINRYLENSEDLYNPEFSIINLTEKLNSNRTYISKAINGYYKQTFQIYINELRVKALLKMLSEQKNRNIKLDVLMQQVGFANRSTFIKSFQKFTGITPSAFLKNLKIKE